MRDWINSWFDVYSELWLRFWFEFETTERTVDYSDIGELIWGGVSIGWTIGSSSDYLLRDEYDIWGSR